MRVEEVMDGEFIDRMVPVFLLAQEVACTSLRFDGESHSPDFELTIEGATEEWRRWKSSLDEDAWSDGKHDGDCTNCPHTCARCLVEHAIDDARALTSILLNKDVCSLVPAPEEHQG